LAFTLAWVGNARGQNAENKYAAPSRLMTPIDEQDLLTLHGNVRQDLTADNDLGAVEDGMPLHLFLLLQRTTKQQADLDNLLTRQQQPTAAEYHKWLKPKEFGARFGASPEDIATLTAWLQSHGFQVRGVLNNASTIDFAATAGQVREAFHTEMHYFNIRGGKHAANVRDPQIPAALAPVVAGIVGLNKIPPLTNHTPTRQTAYDEQTHRWHPVDLAGADGALPDYDSGAPYYLVTPQDFYTIYNVNPVFSGSELAANATVAVIEQSDIEYGTVNSSHVATGGDVATFRTLFGVPGTLNMHVYHGYGTVACNAPGIDPNGNGEDGEASLDAEWINATAPSANLIFMSCDQSPDNGIWSSMAALIDNNLSDVMSLSYGDSELNFTSGNYTFLDNFYAQAAAQGQSIFISSGDSGSDVADQNTTGSAVSGINVSAFGSPLVTVTGGTDFSDYYDAKEGGTAQSTYWSSTNSAHFGDALGYVPETAWNDSCASSIYAAEHGYSGAGYCGYVGSKADGSVVGGSGGISTHYAVPAWQTGISGYSGAHRSQPDIAGFAANGFWGHYLIFCDSHNSSSTCQSPSTFGGAGGTSFVAPYMAGVAGLLVDYTGSRQGLLNPALYALGKAQYTAAATATACYSNGQTSNTGVTTGQPAAACIFNDVTTSNNDVPCQTGSTDCYVNPSTTYGMLSLSGSSSLSVAFPSLPGFDQVTGIGTVNVHNLLTNWNTAFTTTTGLAASITTMNPSQSTNLTATVTGGTPTGFTGPVPPLSGSVSFAAGSTSLGNCTLSAGTCSLSVSGAALQEGANSVTATFVGSNAYPSSTSSIVTVSVASGTTSQTITFGALPNVTYGASAITLGATASSGLAVNYSVTGPASVSGSTLTITGAGQVKVTASQGGNATYAPATPVSQSFTVAQAALTVIANNASRGYGAANPVFTYSITGYVNGDSSSVVSGTATETTTATTASALGTYPITFSTESLAATNYTFTYVGGTLTVTTATQTISFGALPNVTYGAGAIPLGATASSGLAVSYSVTGPATLSGSTLTITGAGLVKVTASQAGNTDYAAATSVAQSFNVAQAVLTVTANNATRIAETANPAFTYSIAGYVNGDTSSVVSGTAAETTTATTASLPGTYPISFSTELLVATNYTFTYVNGTLTVTGAAAQTITFGAFPNATYGASAIPLGATASSGLTVSYSVTGPATLSGTTLTITGAGLVTVTATQGGNGTYAAAAPVTQSFNVAKAGLTVTANNTSRAYGAANPAFTYSIAGYVNGDTSSVVSGTATETTTATIASTTGTYPISFSSESLTATNYTFTYVNGTLTVTGATQTITFGSLPNVTYGASAITLSATASSGLAVSYAVTGPATLSGSTVTITGAGLVTVTASQAGNGNYAAAASVAQSFNVARAVLTVTANNAAKAYGTANPAFGYTITGFVYADTASVVSGTATETSTATTTSAAGTYPITFSTESLTATNYTFTYVSGTLTVTTSTPQTITFGPLPNVTYGASAITLGATASSGLAVSYSVTGPAALSGSTLTITGAGLVTVTASQAGNGTYAAATPVAQSFTVASALLTVAASNASRVYGAANPAFTYTITGYVNGDTASVVSGSATEATTATAASTAGTYPISFSTESLSATNYTFTYINGTLTVTAQAQTITFGTLPNVTYGASAITLSATASSGLAVNYSVTGPATLSGSTLTITGAGLVTVTATQPGNTNYAAATAVAQSFTVASAVLTVTANNASRAYGAANPAFTYSITGYVNGDTPGVVSGTAAETTTATATSATGTYPIMFSTESLIATNYTFNYVNGTLTVTGAAQIVTFGSLPNVTYGASAITLGATASSGLAVSYAVTGPATLSGSTLTITGAGLVTVTASQAGNNDYAAATPVAQSFTVAPAVLTVTASNATRAVGAANPAFSYSVAGYVNGDTSSVVSGSATETTTATATSAVGTYPITFSTESLTATNYTFTYVNGTLTVTAVAAPGFTITARDLTVTAGATTGNTSTITVAPSGGFTGPVTLTAAITSSPSGAQDPPSLSFGSTSPLTISGTSPGTATVTITTTAEQGTQCFSSNRTPRVPWYAGGGAVLACMLLFGIPARRRSWRAMVGMAILLAVIASGAVACGGGGSTTCNNALKAGTTAGNYTVTVTGTSGPTTATGTFTITVQ
jgi:hypothetical protein